MIENEIIEIQAKVAIEQLLLRRHTAAQIQAVMARHDLKLSKAETTRYIKAVKEDWLSASEDLREERREQQRRSLEHLYSTAFSEKKYSVCLGVERLLAEIDGTMAPKRVQVSSGKREDDEFSDRSELECAYYAEHGYWPDENPKEMH